MGSSTSLDRMLLELAAAPAVDPQSQGFLAPGTVIDSSYEIVRQLGAGGMGIVYQAKDIDLDRPVAIKFRLGKATPSQMARLWREGRIMARLSHPNVVAVFEVGTYNGMLFIAMEFLKGGTTRTWMKERKRSWKEIVDFFVQAGRGLAAAHEVGVVHRDFKPDNVLVGADGRVRVADFGLAQAADTEEAPEPSHADSPGSRSSDGVRLTQTGATVGTPAYMAPEQHTGGEVDARADQFAFCVALHEALYGMRPFKGDSLPELIRHVSQGSFETLPARAPVPARIHRAIRRGLDSDPRKRWPTMNALIAALTVDTARRRRRILLSFGGLATAAAVGTVAYQAGDRGPRCGDGYDAIEPIWNDDARRDLAQAFESSGLPMGPAAATRVSAVVDGYADAWAAAHVAACEATRIRGEQSEELLDRRMACLERRRGFFEAVVDVLRNADARVVENAYEPVRALPPLDPCANALALRAEVDPPAAAQAEDVAAIRSDVARSNALVAAGQVPESDELATAAVAHARSAGYDPALAEALLVFAKAKIAFGELSDGQAAIEESYTTALGSGHDRVALQAALLFANLFATKATLSHAKTWVANAEALAKRLGLDRRFKIAWARGRMHVNARELTAAQGYLETAIGLADDPVSLAEARTGLADVLGFQERYIEATSVRESVLRTYEATYGSEHWQVGGALQGLANARSLKGDAAEAAELHERAIAIFRESLGDSSPVLADAYNKAGTQASRAGDLNRALSLYKEALRRQLATEGATTANRVAIYANLGGLLADLDQPTEALEYCEKALVAAQEHYGVDSLLTAQVRLNLIGPYAMTGRHDEARRQAELAAAAFEAELGPNNRQLMLALMNLVNMYTDEGASKDDLDTALGYASRAGEIARALHPEEHMDHARAATVRARVLKALGRGEAAADSYERCAEIIERVSGRDHGERVMCLYMATRSAELVGLKRPEPLEEALSIVQAGAEVPPTTAATVYYDAAVASKRTGPARAKRLVAAAQAALATVDPDDTVAAKIKAELAAL